MLENDVPFLLVVSSSSAVDVDPADKNQYVFISVTLAFTTVLPCSLSYCYVISNGLCFRNIYFYVRVGLSQLVSVMYFLSHHYFLDER